MTPKIISLWGGWILSEGLPELGRSKFFQSSHFGGFANWGPTSHDLYFMSFLKSWTVVFCFVFFLRVCVFLSCFLMFIIF